MSYCRKNDESDVYLYKEEDEEGRLVWVCYECKMCNYNNAYMFPVGQALLHLDYHRRYRDKVPQAAIDRLREEMKG